MYVKYLSVSIDLVGHPRANDHAREARPFNGDDAILLGRVGHAPRADGIATGVPRKTPADDVIHGWYRSHSSSTYCTIPRSVSPIPHQHRSISPCRC